MTFLVYALCSAVPDTALKLVMADNRLGMQVTKINGGCSRQNAVVVPNQNPLVCVATLSTLTCFGPGELRLKCPRGSTAMNVVPG